MPRHGTGLGAGNFPAASKLLMRYEHDKAYKLHQQKLHSVKHRLNVDEPKKHNHLILRLKQIQKEEERQAEIDHENKILLNKMTHVLKYGGNIDNWNNYESRSLNYPFREKQNEEIARENIGIARRLESVKPKLTINKWEKDYQQHQYLKRMWSDSVKDYGGFTPRRYRSRMSRTVQCNKHTSNTSLHKKPTLKSVREESKRSLENSLDNTYDEDFHSVDTSEEKKLPKLKKEMKKKEIRTAKSESSVPVTHKKDDNKLKASTKLPKIVPHKALVERDFSMYYKDKGVKSAPPTQRSTGKHSEENGNDKDGKSDSANHKPGKSTKSEHESDEKKKEHPERKKHKSPKKENGKANGSKDEPKSQDTEKMTKSSSSLHSENYITNDLERVKTLVSEDQQKQGSDDEKETDGRSNENDPDQDRGNTDYKENAGKDDAKTGSNVAEEDDFFDKQLAGEEESKENLKASEEKGEINDDEAKQKTNEQNHQKASDDVNKVEKDKEETHDSQKDIDSSHDTADNEKSSEDKDMLTQDEENKLCIPESDTKKEILKEKKKNAPVEGKRAVQSKQSNRKKVRNTKAKRARVLKKFHSYLMENGVSGPSKDDDKSDIAQLFKIAKQLGKPEDIFIKTLIKKSHKQRMVTKAKFRQKYDLDLVTELKNGLGQPWEYLIDALLQERGVADSYAVFDSLSTADMCDVVELLCSRDNATIAELKESYRKEFSISLEEDVTDRSKPPIQTILLSLQKGIRDETPDADIEVVRKDAQALYEYGEGRWESENGIFIKLLNERSFPHLHALFSEYKSVSNGEDILHAMKKETTKEYYKILSTLVQCIGSPASYYAEMLHRHKLPSDPVFVGTLAVRSEIDMPEIKKAYKKVFGVDITEDIRSKSHPTQKCLIELANKIPPGSKKKADTKKTYVKDGAADQQSHPQPAHAKKPPPGKKPDPKVKGQGQSESGDTVTSTKTDNETKNSTKKPEHKPAQQSKSKDNQESKKASTGASDGNHRGTVKPASNFRPDDDCDRLNSAMSGERADESVVVSIIPKRSNRQRQQLKSTYEQKFTKNLTIDLTSEMTGDWEEIVLALMMTPAEYDAHVVREAVEGLGTAEPTLIAILCTRTAQELKAIKEHYRKVGGGDFDMDVTRDCGADLKNLLLHLARGERVADTSVNIQQAQKDAKELHQNGIQSNTFVEVVSKLNHFQVKATFDEYKKVAGEDIYAAITKASLGDDEDVYISIAKAVEDPMEFYAQKLHGCFTSMGTNDNLLIRMVVPRSEVDLEDIKMRYFELYSRSLYDAVNGQCQGDYKAMLLAVIHNDEEDVKGNQKKQSKPKPTRKESGQKSVSGGTVKPAKPFNPIEDSERLNGAMSGFGTDEAIIIDILPHRTNDQRQEIKAKYQDKYNKNLQDQLESELRGDFEEIVLALMMKQLDYACHCLHESVKGLGTKEGILIGVLCTKTNKELAIIKNRYKEIYGKDLLQAIIEDVSRGMEDMFVEILKCERDQGETANIQEAKEDAKRLYKEGQISIDPTDDVFRSIIARKSRAQVKATFQEYKKLTGNDIYYGIEKALIGDDEDAYLGLARAIEDPIWFYAEALHSCFDGLGTNDTRLIRIIVSRSEIDLADIKAKYKSLYNRTVSERVEAECNGDYKTVLLAILGDHAGDATKEERIGSGESNDSQSGNGKAKRHVSVVLPDPAKSDTQSTCDAVETNEETNIENTDRKNDDTFEECCHDRNSDKNSGLENTEVDEQKDEKSDTVTESTREDAETNEGTNIENTDTKNDDNFGESSHDKNCDNNPGHENIDVDEQRDDKNDTVETEKATKERSRVSEKENSSISPKNENDEIAHQKNSTSKISVKKKKVSVNKVKRDDKKKDVKRNGKNKESKKPMAEEPNTAENCTQYDPNDCIEEDKENAELDEDCRQLNEAMHAKRTNKEAINEIISELSEDERQALREAYRNRYDRDILDDIKHELKGPHLLLVQSLFKDQSHVDAENFHNAVTGFGTDENLMLYLLITRNPQKTVDMKRQYVKLFGREMSTDVTNETSGLFQRLCLQLVNKTEQVQSEGEDTVALEEKVIKLWKPGEKLDQNGNNDILIDLLSRCTSKQYRDISDLYKKASEISFAEAVARSTKGDFQEALLSLASYLAMPADYHAQNIARAFKGFRKNDRLLISVLLPNLQENVAEVQDAYKSRYKTSLEDAIKSNCGSGDYGKLWLKLMARKNTLENEEGDDKADSKK